MDVRRTADDQLVIIHDATLDRTTTGSGAVNTLTLAEIKRLDAGFHFSPTGAKVVVSNERDFPYRGKGVSVPTLEEVFETFPAKRILIEIKKGEPVWVAEKLCATIRQHERTQTTLVASVNHATLTLFRARCAEVATSASADEARDFLALRFAHLTAAYSPAFHALQVPPMLGDLPIITREFVNAAHARNLRVHPWTINDEQEMRRLLDMKVDGIITDRPDILIELLR
jgi:glycerophosphoryl diester phosphodiesterase